MGAAVDDAQHPRSIRETRGDLGVAHGFAPPFDIHSLQRFVKPLGFGRELALGGNVQPFRSEEHTSAHQSLMRSTYALYFLKNKQLFSHSQVQQTPREHT